jgi:hypothetical protein
MKTWYVQFLHRTEHSQVRGYTVVAEDDDMAAEVGKESLENDEKNWDADPRNWSFMSAMATEICSGCGGLRRVIDPPGQGAIR